MSAQQAGGEAGATRAIQAAAPALCAATNNSVLTSGALSELARIANSNDATVLDQITYFGGDGSRVPTASNNGPITDPVQICAIENMAEFNIILADTGSKQRLGSRLANAGYASDLMGAFFQHRTQDGDSAALSSVRSQATQLCSASTTNSVLARQDVSDLMSIAPSTDAALLQRISVFGP